MTLHEILKDKLFRQLDHDELLLKIGYRCVTSNTRDRLLNLQNDELLGLTKSRYDFKFSNKEFLNAVCRVFDINLEDYEDEIAEIEDKVRMLNYKQAPYLFVETGFKRTTQPIFVLAFMEGKRHVVLPQKLLLKTKEEIIEVAKSAVIDHYLKTGGEIQLWGKIKKYILCLPSVNRVVFSVDGVVVEEGDINTRRASLSVKNKEITSLFNN